MAFRAGAAGLALVLVTVACGGAKAPGQQAFSAANSLITVFEEKKAFGNTPDAERLAERFGYLLKAVRTFAFTEGKNGPSLSQGQFLTYCQLSEHGVLFLVHVPELRNFTESAQEQLLKLAWMIATRATEGLRIDGKPRLGVGLRGALIYGGIATGPMGAEQPEMQQTSGVVELEKFYPFFDARALVNVAVPARPAAPVVPDTPAGGEPQSLVVERLASSDNMVGHLALITGPVPATAFVVAADLLAAAERAGAQSYSLQLANGGVVQAIAVGHLTGAGLMLLRPVMPTVLDPAVLRADGDMPAVGSDVFGYVAMPSGDSVVGARVRGVIRGLRLEKAGALVVDTDIAIPPGGLGGPLVDAQGRVIAVAVQIGADHLYVAASHIRRLQKTVTDGQLLTAGVNATR